MCDYHGYNFGANYPDARCIDGYLWDEDSIDDGYFTSGGYDPCPQCNTKSWLKRIVEEVEDSYSTGVDGSEVWLVAVKSAGKTNKKEAIDFLKNIGVVCPIVSFDSDKPVLKVFAYNNNGEKI